MAITKEQVFAAADRLFDEGTAPTLIGIRKDLGSGSFSTISTMLAEWKSASRKGDVVAEEMPDDVQAIVEAAGSRLWALALKMARDDAQLTKDESAELVKMAEAARDEALQLATDLQVENDKMVDQVMKLQAAVESAEWTKIELNKELAQARSVLEENRESYRQLLARVDRPGKPTPKSSPILAKKVFAVPKVKAK
jgi:hypothetical protein